MRFAKNDDLLSIKLEMFHIKCIKNNWQIVVAWYAARGFFYLNGSGATNYLNFIDANRYWTRGKDSRESHVGENVLCWAWLLYLIFPQPDDLNAISAMLVEAIHPNNHTGSTHINDLNGFYG